MRSQPKVSVIIPVYNVEKYLRECLDSIANQTLQEIEIICVDDGSTDSSCKILHEYARRDDRFIILEQENKGAGAARNLGLTVARGDYLLFLDSDDFFEREMIEKSYDTARDVDADIVIFQSDRYIQNENKFVRSAAINYALLPDKKCFSANEVEKNIFRSVVGWTWDKLFKHSFVKENHLVFQEIRVHNDLLFTYAALASAERITVLRSLFTHQRKRGGGSISDEFKEWECTYEALFALKEYLCRTNRYDRFERDYINYAAYLLLYNMQRLSGAPLEEYKRLMRQKWLDDLGISEAEEESFYDKGHFKQCRRVLYSNAETLASAPEPQGKPKVSIIIPSLNSIAYMEECIRSAVNQTLRDIEIICVDAGSTDGTVALLEGYASTDARIRVVHSDKKSYGYQINLGLDLAQGEYIGILESDDYVLDEMYECLYNVAISNHCDAVKSDFCSFFGEKNERVFSRKHLSSNKGLYKKVLHPQEDTSLFRTDNVNPPGIYSTALIRGRGIRLNESPGASFQDNGLWFQIFMWSQAMYFYPKAFYMIRRDNPNSSVHSKEKVYCSCGEYDYIRQVIHRSADVKKYAPICAYFRHNNYNFTLNRIAQEFKLEFLQRYAQDFKALEQAGELDRSWFSAQQWATLRKIMDTPEEYFYTRYIKKETVKVPDHLPADVQALQKKVKLLTFQVNALNKEILAIRSSWTYRIGRFITWLPRKVRGGLHCYQEHGFHYTLERVLVHLHLKKDPHKISSPPPKPQPVPASTSKPAPAPKPQPIKRDYDYFRKLPPEMYEEELTSWYKRVTGTPLDLENPKTFNEKIQWLKLYDSTPLKTRLADKYLVRDWVTEKIGDKYLIPLLGVWDSFDDIDFDTLPDQFALKANHNSGGNIIVQDKAHFDMDEARKKFDYWLNRNYAFGFGLELHYMNIPPKIIAEKYMADLAGDIYDYRFFCFNGTPQYVWVDVGSGTTHHKRNIYDMNWNLQNYRVNYPFIKPAPDKPETFEEMAKCAEILCRDFAFVRVDFYSVGGQVYFGEMTFTPQSGAGKWESEEQNKLYGSLIQLPPKSPLPERKF